MLHLNSHKCVDVGVGWYESHFFLYIQSKKDKNLTFERWNNNFNDNSQLHIKISVGQKVYRKLNKFRHSSSAIVAQMDSWVVVWDEGVFCVKHISEQPLRNHRNTLAFNSSTKFQLKIMQSTLILCYNYT